MACSPFNAAHDRRPAWYRHRLTQRRDGMKKFAFGFACVLAGCAAGAAMPHVTAQTFAPNPGAHRWQQFCDNEGTSHFSGRSYDRSLSESIAGRGMEGWEHVAFTANG